MKLVGNVHLIAGNAEDIPAILSILQEEGIATVANPDLYVRTYRNFGIDEARELSERASARAFVDRRTFVIIADALTHEAQNALLKTLEEPTGDALFLFIVPAPAQLLPTLKSRAQELPRTVLGSAQYRGRYSVSEANDFLKATPAQRLELLKPLLEKGEDDPEKPRGNGAGKRDVGSIIRFLGALERSLAEMGQRGGAGEREKVREGLHAVFRARKYITDRGALVKPLLEQVALLI